MVKGRKDLEAVSIPKRVSEALKLPYVPISTSQVFKVSIPKRVSEALKLAPSLLINCFAPVSIPKRVSEALKPAYTYYCPCRRLVSIPKRVSEALKQHLGRRCEEA